MARPAIKRVTLSNNQVFAIAEVANIDHASSQALEKAFRSKYGFGVWYPPVNEMRILAARRTQAEQIQPVKIALALEGMEN